MTVELIIILKKGDYQTEERSWKFIDEVQAMKAIHELAQFMKDHVRLTNVDTLPFEWKS